MICWCKPLNYIET
uniref:Uncharacterized protein n=1 Tax=Rhizophora mucronata TaxID=61149 RepID=A0A2P2QK89_RHIMU